MKLRIGFLAVLAFCIPAGAAGQGAVDRTPADEAPETPHLRQLLSGPPAPLGIYDTAESRRIWKLLRTFYGEREFRPVWSDGRGGFPYSMQLFHEVRSCAEHGLDPFAYPADSLEARIREAVAWDPEGWAETDLSLSFLFVTYASHLGRGRIDPKGLPEIEWFLPRRKLDPTAILGRAIETGNVEGALHASAPPHAEYRRLARALHRLRDDAVRGWPKVSRRDFRAEYGDTLAELPAIRAYLEALGDLPPGPVRDATVMDDVLESGVRNYQGRHGLVADGILGPRTLAQMRVPATARLRSAILNLERWRWMPDSLAVRRVMVNVPSYDLEVIEGAAPVLAMRVIAGTRDTPTPSFRETIRHLEINPPWHVPESIAGAEILPKAQEDPDYLLAENITVIDSTGKPVDPASVDWSVQRAESLRYRFRQEPGGGNPLGSIKFLFPNPWSVYLHDTPNTKLFAKDFRALSHGCVRIEKPLDMADYLLREQTQWTREELIEFVKSGKRRWVDLKKPLPIYILYFTAGVGRDEKLQFSADVYGRDAILADALAAYTSPWTEPPDTTLAAADSTTTGRQGMPAGKDSTGARRPRQAGP